MLDRLGTSEHYGPETFPIRPQNEQRRFVTHATLVETASYAKALAYLTQYEKSDFPRSRRLEPNPYEYRVWRDLPPTIALLTSGTPPWIRQVYLNHLTATTSHYYPQYDSLPNVAAMLLAIERLPEGREWLLTNQTAIARQGLGLRQATTESMGIAERIARTNILNSLSRMGMTDANLAHLIE
jgi:hypothetical protein